MSNPILVAEFQNDPESLGYAHLIAEGATGKIVEILNAPRYEAVGKVAIEEYVGFLIDIGKFAGIIAAANAGDALAGALVGQLRVAKELGIRNVDMSSPIIQGQHQLLIDANFITVDDLQDINAMATSQISRAAMLDLDGPVTLQSVIEALGV